MTKKVARSHSRLVSVALGAIAGFILVYQAKKIRKKKLEGFTRLQLDSNKKSKVPLCEARAKSVQGLGNIIVKFY